MRQENAVANTAEKRSGKSEGAFRTISEVAEELDVPQHVLRFWESRFSQIRPLKRGGNRRYYRPEDVVLLYRIRDLLYKEGYTIKGVQRILKTPGAKGVSTPVATADTPTAGDPNLSSEKQDHLSFDLAMPPAREAVESKRVDSFPSGPFPSAELIEDPVEPQEKKPVQGELQDILSELLDLKKLLGETIR